MSIHHDVKESQGEKISKTCYENNFWTSLLVNFKERELETEVRSITQVTNKLTTHELGDRCQSLSKEGVPTVKKEPN
jgi:hypothetical protein